jgi:hypothetical protein
MKISTGRRALIAVGVAGAVALFGLTGCGRAGGRAATADSQAETSDLGWDAQALQSIGLNTMDLAPAATDPASSAGVAPSSSASGPAGAAGGKRKHRLVRFMFGKSTLHGEAVVKTDDGTKTVVVQRGVVTAIDATSVTVKSSDGFILTWTFGTPITVIERRTQVQPSAIAVGAEVALAGAKSGTSQAARLIVVAHKKA